MPNKPPIEMVEVEIDSRLMELIRGFSEEAGVSPEEFVKGVLVPKPGFGKDGQ
jgi:hypothetical protein